MSFSEARYYRIDAWGRTRVPQSRCTSDEAAIDYARGYLATGPVKVVKETKEVIYDGQYK